MPKLISCIYVIFNDYFWIEVNFPFEKIILREYRVPAFCQPVSETILDFRD